MSSWKDLRKVIARELYEEHMGEWRLRMTTTDDDRVNEVPDDSIPASNLGTCNCGRVPDVSRSDHYVHIRCEYCEHGIYAPTQVAVLELWRALKVGIRQNCKLSR